MEKFIKEWVLPIIAVVLLSIAIQKFLFFQIIVPTGSMRPTINEGDRIFVAKVYDPEKLETGDIVVFKVRPRGVETLYVKRLIGTPGDKVEINGGVVSVNGETLDEPYIVYPDRYTGSFDVPEGKYFFMGDNRIDSKDSRYSEVGFIDIADIVARAGLKFWPINGFGILK